MNKEACKTLIGENNITGQFMFGLPVRKQAASNVRPFSARVQNGLGTASNNIIPFPKKKYGIIYADPPWSYDDKHCRGAAADQYDTMSQKDIMSLPVQDIAADDCVLFLWATYPKLREALDVINAWGFQYKSIAFQWIKENPNGIGYFFGLGRWTRGNTEPCLIAVRGEPKRAGNAVSQLVFSPVRRHSQKPDEVRDKIVDLMGDLPRIELFARNATDGWDIWGNEAPMQKTETAA